MNRRAQGRGQRGFSLIELMISLVLGVLLISGVISVLLSNRQSYRSNSGLSQLQESSRIAFELIARSLRQAGLTGCANTYVATVLNKGSNNDSNSNSILDDDDAWWGNFAKYVNGYEGGTTDPSVTTGTAAAQRVAGTDSLQVLGVADNGLSVADHDPSASVTTIKLNDAGASLAAGDIFVVCDPDHAAIAQVSAYNSAQLTLTYAASTGGVDGNCSTGLGFPTTCTGANNYKFIPNSQIALLSAVTWYVGTNPQGGRSLYQMTLRNSAGTPGGVAQEIVRDVTDLQLQYLSGGAFINADAVTDWPGVTAVRMTLTVAGSASDRGTDGKAISRQFSTSVTLRNRVN